MTDVALDELEPRLEQHRAELTWHCSKLLGSRFEAEDAAQETLLRAWRSFDRFEGRCTMRAWLYRIATNVCIDQINCRQRRPLPMDPSSPGSMAEGSSSIPLDRARVEPMRGGSVAPPAEDPLERAIAREDVRLAFVAAFQLLSPRQRAVLILREVLRWPAVDVAELLDTSVAAVNSALQRARAALATGNAAAAVRSVPADQHEQALLARSVDAFERFDVDELVSLLRTNSRKTPYAACEELERLATPA